MSNVARDIQAIIDSNPMTELVLNASNCEITTKNFEILDKFFIFKDFQRGPNITGCTDPRRKSSWQGSKGQDCHSWKINRTAFNTCLIMLSACYSDAKAAIYILWTAPCDNNPLLLQFDMVLKNGLRQFSTSNSLTHSGNKCH